MFSSHREQ